MGLKIGTLLRITPDNDQFDNLRVKIISLCSGYDTYNVEIISGDRKGEVLDSWYLSEMTEISPLEQLAEVAE